MGFMGNISETPLKCLTSDTTFSKYLLIVDAYSKTSKLYGMEIITIEEVMDKFDMFQSRSVKIDEFGWWDLEIVLLDSGTLFTSTELQENFQTRGIRLTLAAPEQ